MDIWQWYWFGSSVRRRRTDPKGGNDTLEAKQAPSLQQYDPPRGHLGQSPSEILRAEEALKNQPSRSIFISYRRSDAPDTTGRIYDRLTEHFGRDYVYKDVDSIPLGVDFRQHIEVMVSDCSILLVVIGKHWLGSGESSSRSLMDNPADFVRIEVESALKRGIPVIPTLVQGASMPSEENLPPTLKELIYRNGMSVRPDPDFHRDLDRLISSIEAHLGRWTDGSRAPNSAAPADRKAPLSGR